MTTPIPLLDAIDLEILMHKDAHFGKSFPVMLDYYHQDGVGVMPDFEISRIEYLMSLEKHLGQNLSEECLPEAAKEAVMRSIDLYVQLREVYEDPSKSVVSTLLSDLILCEDELAEKEIEAISAQKEAAVDPLIHLISAPTFYDPINPGYGRAPIFAADCLAKIQNPKCIPHLFEALSYDNFYTDEAMITALIKFGQKAKDFILKIITGNMITKDTEIAAMLLASFPPDEEIGKVALCKLEDKNILKKENLASYLVCACEGLSKDEDRDRFYAIAKCPEASTMVANEILIIAKTWR